MDRIMQSRIIDNVFKNGFWLSVLLHLLLLLAFLTLMTAKPRQKEEEPPLPHYYVPAYTYTGSIKPSSAVQKSQSHQKNASQPKTKVSERTDTTENTEQMQSVENTLSTLRVPKILKKMPAEKISKPIRKSFLADSFNMLKEDQMREVSEKKESEPIYMIGDDSQPADPLIKLLGRSISAHFGYPRMAGQLGIRGRVIVELTLHPEGYYSNVRMLQSSQNQDLDAAALYAVNSAPRIDGADRFISKPKHFVIGFIFN